MISHWDISAPALVVVFATVVWAVSIWICWQNWRRRGGRGGVAALEMFRFAIISLILLTLLKPERVRRTERAEQPEIVVLADASGSMKTRDVVLDGNQVLRRDEWLGDRQRTNFWKPLTATAKVIVEEFGKPSTNVTANAEEGSDLSTALDAVLTRQKNLKAVLLISDGDWNLGASPLNAATKYRGQKVPVYTVSVGSERSLPDLVVEPMALPSFGLLGEQISIPFKITSHLPQEVKTFITLSSGADVDARKPITVPPFGQVQGNIVWAPRALGNYSFRLSVPVQTGEYLADNNEQNFHIAIRTEKLRVLVIESLPRWEYRYLRNALVRDPGVEASTLLFHPGMDPGQGTGYLTKFPATREELAKYDVIFIGDVGLGGNELTAKDCDLIKGLVEQQASGLVFLPGERGRQATFLQHPIGEMVPVLYDDQKTQGISVANESNLHLTATGKGHFLTMLAPDENRNDSIWKNLPGFYWCAGVAKAKPGADVLAVHSSLRNTGGRLPLLVTRPYGSGEVLFMGTDSAWRWRRGVEDRYHYRFWGQVVRWMAHKRHMAGGEGLRLSYSPENPKVDESIFLQATALDLGGTGKETVSATITSPTSKTERLDFTPVEGGWGVFKATFVPREGGKYRVSLAGQNGKSKLEADVLVTKPVREKLGQPANPAILREVSELTRALSGSVSELDRIVRAISALPEKEPTEERLRLWANAWWGGAMLLLLAIYWTLRKVLGLI